MIRPVFNHLPAGFIFVLKFIAWKFPKSKKNIRTFQKVSPGILEYILG